MKKIGQRFVVCIIWVLLLGTTSVAAMESASASETSKAVTEKAEGTETEGFTENYLDVWMEELDFGAADEFVETELFPEQREPIRFSSLVEEILTDGFSGFDYTRILEWAKDALLYEAEVNQKILIQVVLLAVGFSILKNFSGAFREAYISDICFLFVYGVLAVLLLQSFEIYVDIAETVLRQSVDFMKALVPTFCISMVFSSGAESSAGFYQMAFLVIYLIQWLFLNVLIPCIHIYIIMEIFNHFFEDEKFENLTELLKGAVNWGMKSAGVVVLGMNVVQGLIAPAKDRLMSGTVSKAAAVIPGVGNVVSGIGELLLGSGILIKNCVGVAALGILVVIGVMPVLKIALLSVMYKISAAVVEPVSDKRIAGCLNGMAKGGMLYLKLVLYCLALSFVTIALATASSGFAR